MSDAPDEPIVVQGRVCLSCGYDLTGLRSDRTCPECGAPVERSLHGNLLRFSSADYLRSLHHSVILALAAAIAAVALLVVTVVLSASAPNLGLGERSVDFLCEGLLLGTTLVSITGWWMFSAPDPATVGKDQDVRARRLLRISLIAEPVLLIAGFTAEWYFQPAAPAAPAMLVRLETMTVVVWLLRFFTSMVYVRTVAARVPDTGLRARAGRFMWLAPLMTVLTCGFGIVVAFAMYVVMLRHTELLLAEARAQNELLARAS